MERGGRLQAAAPAPQMALTFETAESLFRAGRYVELLARQPTTPAALAALPQDYRLLLAHTLVQTGQPRAALALVQADHVAGTSPLLRSRCEVILGLARRREASLAEAIRHFQLAVQYARESRNSREIGWASVQLFRAHAELHSIESALVTLADVRLHVTRAGDPHLTAYLHDALALMEVSAGRLAAARRHLAISTALLDTYPNAWLRQVTCISGSCLDFFDCRYEDAIAHAHTARALMQVVGEQHKAIIDSNEGHALLKMGRFDPARLRLNDALREASVFHRLGALEGLARIALATGSLETCVETLAEIDRFCRQDRALPAALGVRWGVVTRMRVLLRQQRWQEAADEATRYLANAAPPGDRHLWGSVTCLHARALAGLGRLADAGARLLSVDTQDDGVSRELQADWYWAAGTLLAEAGSPVSDAFGARAAAVWQHHRDSCAPLEAGPLPARQPSADAGDARPAIMGSIAALFELSYSPRMLAHEVLDLLDGLQCSPGARIVETRTDDKAAGATAPCALPLGEVDGSRITLVCPLPADPVRALTLGGVLRVVRSAVALQHYREEDRRRAALWPEDPAVTQTGALFLAEDMQALLVDARRAAATDVPVLITGETGTGKEVLARTVHACSSRARATFLPFNCTATPREMMDSQLFGHRRGAFTGASDHFPGVIRAAAGGTLFLDEIGEMGLDVQPKLLRFLESNEVHPIGETHPVHVDVRLIAATNADLPSLVAQGRFRQDLFYRLAIVRLHVPPLRERRVEIPALALHYLQKHAQAWQKGALRLAEETMEYLVFYRWPGNIRQLANEMRRVAALAEPDSVVLPGHLSPEIAASRRTVPAGAGATSVSVGPASAPVAFASAPGAADPASPELGVRLDQPLAAAIERLEKMMIEHALARCGGHVEETARQLGLSRKGLYLKRQRYGLSGPGMS